MTGLRDSQGVWHETGCKCLDGEHCVIEQDAYYERLGMAQPRGPDHDSRRPDPMTASSSKREAMEAMQEALGS